MTLPKLNMSTIKDVIYIAGIIVALFLHFRDKAVTQAKFQTQVEERDKVIIENQNNILEKLKESDAKWINQAEINGKFTMFIVLQSDK